MQEKAAINLRHFQWAMKFDFALQERPKKLPEWLKVGNETGQSDVVSAKIVETYLPQYVGAEKKNLNRLTYLEVFGDEAPKAVLFDYGRKDLLDHAEYQILPMEEVKGREV